ncbi:hypothetical protein E4U12_008478 [Claviceps purpurea]|nr:hypothetical protein E4U12_008478 [Claviceps purpurea]
MDKDYWIYFETKVVHMMFVSWGGILFHVHKAGMDQLETLHDVPWVDEGVRAFKAVHNEGVLHCDVRWGNKDTRKEDGLRMTDQQLHIEACNEAEERATEEEHEIYKVIQDALGIDSDDSESDY